MGAARYEEEDAGEVGTAPAPGGAAAAASPPAHWRAEPPLWLSGLFHADIFCPCPRHPGARKNDCNLYCLDCTPGVGRAMCAHCVPAHAAACDAASVLQIRRYMYQNVVHVADLTGMYDTEGVQAYCINQQRAMLLRPKAPAARAPGGGGAGGGGGPAFTKRCGGCAIPLRSDCDFCSLQCKVNVDHGLGPSTPGSTNLDDGGSGAAASTAPPAPALRPPTASVGPAPPRRATATPTGAAAAAPAAATGGPPAVKAARPFSATVSALSAPPTSEGGSSERATVGSVGAGRRKKMRPARSCLE
jgi:hypothetical protein